MFELTLPEDEANLVQQTYAAARVILEYGSGGSTRLAAEMPGKLIFSVESDRVWARNLQMEIDRSDLPSSAILYPVYIGKTGKWGRPVDTGSWQKFHRYPLAIWDEPFFRHPDVVLIDGRFRPACFAATCLKITKPVTVLFDDYAERVKYHVVEQIVAPNAVIGRMARFELSPGMARQDAISLLISLFSEATYAKRTPNYEDPFDPRQG